jgi:regulator of sigma E protease
MSNTLIVQLLQFVGGIAILIIVHELGHFIAARLLKVEVEEFGIGFPPRAVKLFEAWGTKFTLNWIPLGGFVRPKGENDPNVPGGLAAASPWVRLTVLFAGPMMNILLGIVLAILIIFSLGEPDKVKVASVSPGSPAEQAGLLAGDTILAVNGQEVHGSNELYNQIYDNLGVAITVTYLRGDQTADVSLVPRNPPPADGAIGIEMETVVKPTTWGKAIPRGAGMVYDYTRSVLSLPVRIAQGEVSPEEGRPLGYKGMFDVYQEIQNPLWFFMIITMSLGIFNLLPIPALDGGRIMLILPEIIIRRRIPPKFENMIHFVGFALLLILLIYINLQDFINPIQLP